MSYTSSDFRGEARDSIGFSDCSGQELFSIMKNAFLDWTRENHIPATITEDVFKTGGLLTGSRAPMLLINHPDPSCKYFTLGVYVVDNIVYFPLLGKSAEQYKYNMKEYNKSKGSFIQAALTRPNEIKIQQEMQWQYDVLSCIDAYFKS